MKALQVSGGILEHSIWKTLKNSSGFWVLFPGQLSVRRAVGQTVEFPEGRGTQQ